MLSFYIEIIKYQQVAKIKTEKEKKKKELEN